jgi:hypothetical protein
MFLKKIHPFFIAGCIIVNICSCGYKELPTQKNKIAADVVSDKDLIVYKKKEYVNSDYRGDKFRDPFVPLNVEGFSSSSMSDEAVIPNIGSLMLKGIFDDSKSKIALISGGGVNYILKGSHLFDNRQRLVRGISGIIKKDSVIMIAPDKTTKELKLKQK